MHIEKKHLRCAVRCAVDLALCCAARGEASKILRFAALRGSARQRTAARCRTCWSLIPIGFTCFLILHYLGNRLSFD
jgi:hypothetical protein